MKQIKFNLILDGKPVRSIEELQNNFNLDDILDYFFNFLKFSSNLFSSSSFFLTLIPNLVNKPSNSGLSKFSSFINSSEIP